MGCSKPMATFSELKSILTIKLSMYQGSARRQCITLLELAIGCWVNCRAKAIIYWEYSSLWRLFCYNWAVHCRHKHNLMKQLQLFKVDIYSQIQLYHQRIRARCCPWGKAAWTCSPLTRWAFFRWTRSPSNWTPSPPESWWLERRGVSSPAPKILEIVAFMAPHQC